MEENFAASWMTTIHQFWSAAICLRVLDGSQIVVETAHCLHFLQPASSTRAHTSCICPKTQHWQRKVGCQENACKLSTPPNPVKLQLRGGIFGAPGSTFIALKDLKLFTITPSVWNICPRLAKFFDPTCQIFCPLWLGQMFLPSALRKSCPKVSALRPKNIGKKNCLHHFIILFCTMKKSVALHNG